MHVFFFENLTQFIPPADNLSIKDRFFSVMACLLSILVVTSASYFISHSPVLLASMGASVVILLFAPNSLFAQPWSFVLGQLVSAFVGVSCNLYLTPFWLASTMAVGMSIIIMLCLRCLHPPGAATALVPVIGGSAFIEQGYQFVVMPVFYNIVIILLIALIINRGWFKRDYPQSFKVIALENEKGLLQQDIQQALKTGGEFIDVNINELYGLLLNVEQQKSKRLYANITCADIMTKEITTVEYGDEVEMVWQKMHHQKLKAIPVVDKANRIIGIITWADFFKFVEFSPYLCFQDKLLTFIRRTPHVSTKKPEVAGHIMNKQVSILSETALITDLIYLFSNQKHQQIPIVNCNNKLIGMVFQSDLIRTLNDKILSI